LYRSLLASFSLRTNETASKSLFLFHKKSEEKKNTVERSMRASLSVKAHKPQNNTLPYSQTRVFFSWFIQQRWKQEKVFSPLCRTICRGIPSLTAIEIDGYLCCMYFVDAFSAPRFVKVSTAKEYLTETAKQLSFQLYSHSKKHVILENLMNVKLDDPNRNFKLMIAQNSKKSSKRTKALTEHFEIMAANDE